MIQKGREITRNNLKQIVSDMFSAEISAVEPELCEDKYLKLESDLLRIEQFSYDLDVINNIYLVGTIPEALPAAEMRAKPLDFHYVYFFINSARRSIRSSKGSQLNCQRSRSD